MGNAVILLIIVAIYIFFVIKFFAKAQRPTNSTTECYVGGLGSGKTLLASKRAKKVWEKAYFRWRFRKFFGLEKGTEKPQLISNIPIVVSNKKFLRYVGKGKGNYVSHETGKRKKYDKGFLDFAYGKFLKVEEGKGDFALKPCYSIKLLPEHLLLSIKIPLNSVVLIDELGNVISQHDYNNPISQKYIMPFVRLFRHWTAGKLIVTDQSSGSVLIDVRRRLNILYNLSKLSTRFFGFVYKISFFEVLVSEDAQTVVNANQLNENYFAGFFPIKQLYKSRTFAKTYPAINKPVSIESFNSLDADYFIDFNYAKNYKNYKGIDLETFVEDALYEERFIRKLDLH